MNLEIIFEVFSMIFCIFYLIVVGISRELIKKEKILLIKLSDEEIEHFSTKKTNTKVFWMVNLGTAILCCIYLLISILNKVINSIIIVIILLPYLLERINVIRRYNKIKQRIENK